MSKRILSGRNKVCGEQKEFVVHCPRMPPVATFLSQWSTFSDCPCFKSPWL